MGRYFIMVIMYIQNTYIKLIYQPGNNPFQNTVVDNKHLVSNGQQIEKEMWFSVMHLAK